MTSFNINLIILENELHVINQINSFIKKFNIDINVFFVDNCKDTIKLFEEHFIDYLFVSDKVISTDELNEIITKVNLSDNTDCIIVFHNTSSHTLKFESKANFLIPEELSFDLFKKLIGYSIVNKSENIANNKEVSQIYKDNFMSSHDSLTMLPNRMFLLDKIDSALKSATIKETNLALFFLDLDGFKDINDTAGHDTGDIVLKEVAKRLIKNTRATDVVARHGGDEFIVFLPHIRSKNDTEIVAEKILAILAEPFVINEESWSISASIGVAKYPDDALTAEKLIANADTAMYYAKNAGKNTIRYFNKELNEKITTKINFQEDIRKAIVDDDFEIVLQPQHNLLTNEIIGAEAFIRWHHKEKGIIMPNDFLPYILNTGYINSLGKLIVQKCLALNYQVNANKNEGIKIAINVEPRQLTGDSFINHITGLKKFGIDTKRLAIEITESCFHTNFNLIKQKLETLRKLGITIHLDDFGLGTSSITHLAELPIDIIKIDNKLLCNSANSEAMKAAVIALSHTFNIKTMAKRIDNHEQLNKLKALGCDYGQGYCYSKPLSVEEFKQYKLQHIVS